MTHIPEASENLVILFSIGMLLVAVLISLAFGEFDHDNW